MVDPARKNSIVSAPPAAARLLGLAPDKSNAKTDSKSDQNQNQKQQSDKDKAAAAADKDDASRRTNKATMQREGANNLVDIINTIFSRILTVIRFYGGDVIKFAGDALLVVWRPESNAHHAQVECCLIAAKAALEMQHKMQNFTVSGVTLTLHCGLACGLLTEIHCGGYRDRWEYLVAGPPIHDMGAAIEASESGQAIVHKKMWDMISEYCQSTPVESSAKYPHDECFHLQRVNYDCKSSPDLVSEMIYFGADRRLKSESMLASYVPKPVLLALNAGKESLIGELRQVTILFINLPDFQYDTPYQLTQNQKAFVCIQKILSRFDGILRQLIQDDKGTVAIIAFGLPYSSHEDDPLRGVLTAMVIQKTLQEHLKMRCGIGVTTGDAYCGTVGNAQRCEYSIVGDCVNLSARLMVNAKSEIRCDADTQHNIERVNTGHGIRFESMGSIKVKGRIEQVPISRPHFQEQAQTLGTPEHVMLGYEYQPPPRLTFYPLLFLMLTCVVCCCGDAVVMM